MEVLRTSAEADSLEGMTKRKATAVWWYPTRPAWSRGMDGAPAIRTRLAPHLADKAGQIWGTQFGW